MINALLRRAIQKHEAKRNNPVGGLYWEEYILAAYLLAMLVGVTVSGFFSLLREALADNEIADEVSRGLISPHNDDV